MSPQESLHTLARRYCLDRLRKLAEKDYLLRSRTVQESTPYSSSEIDLYSRSQLLEDLLQSIEAIVPSEQDFTLQSLTNKLIDAANCCTGSHSHWISHAPANASIPDERTRFGSFLRSLGPADFRDVQPLPYRRLLTEEESSRIWAGLKARWDADRSYWHPLRSPILPSGVLAFHVDYFNREKASVVQRIIEANGIKRIWELREAGGCEYELDTPLFTPQYTELEGYWTSSGFDWLVYASHERSITLAGDWLIQQFEQVFSECRNVTYEGCFSTQDLRGTWDQAAGQDDD